jgi:hypothetical protein
MVYTVTALTGQWNHISGIIVSMLASGAVDCWFELWSGQTIDYKIGIIYLFKTSFIPVLKQDQNSFNVFLDCVLKLVSQRSCSCLQYVQILWL